VRRRGADGITGARRGGGCGLGCMLLGVGASSWWSTQRGLADGNGDGETMSREIEAAAGS
jgi:hypothetical protein